MTLCAKIIKELKALSAQSRALAHAQAQAQAQAAAQAQANAQHAQAQVAAQADSICRRFRLEAEAGTVQFCPLNEDAPPTALPMDPAIRITDVRLAAGQITLTGVADVTP